MKSLKKNAIHSALALKAMLVATGTGLLSQCPGSAAEPAATPPRTVLARPIGNPTWRLADFQLFTAPIGTTSSGYAEFGTTLASVLPPPNHLVCPISGDSCIGLGGPG